MLAGHIAWYVPRVPRWRRHITWYVPRMQGIPRFLLITPFFATPRGTRRNANMVETSTKLCPTLYAALGSLGNADLRLPSQFPVVCMLTSPTASPMWNDCERSHLNFLKRSFMLFYDFFKKLYVPNLNISFILAASSAGVGTARTAAMDSSLGKE